MHKLNQHALANCKLIIMGHFWSWPCRMKEGVIVNIIYSVVYVFLEGTLRSPHSLSTYVCTADPYVTIYMPQAGFDPPKKVIPSSTECEANALPPSHHSWISLAYL